MKTMFAPDYYVETFRKVNINKLVNKGIKLLVCDIDNTLVAHDQAHSTPEVKAFIQEVKDAEIRVVLVSNNVKERVELFAHDLDVKTYPFARKPLKMTYLKLMKDTGYKANEIAVIGDQLLTDILGANRVGFYTILTTPVAQKDLIFTKVNRMVENMVFQILALRNTLHKGEYDE